MQKIIYILLVSFIITACSQKKAYEKKSPCVSTSINQINNIEPCVKRNINNFDIV